MKDADPFIVSVSGMTCFHVCAYRGHLECAIIIVQFSRHRMNMGLMGELKSLMKAYNFKKTDVSGGMLVCSDKHIKSVQ
jgi:ankyrin repeat protein